MKTSIISCVEISQPTANKTSWLWPSENESLRFIKSLQEYPSFNISFLTVWIRSAFRMNNAHIKIFRIFVKLSSIKKTPGDFFWLPGTLERLSRTNSSYKSVHIFSRADLLLNFACRKSSADNRLKLKCPITLQKTLINSFIADINILFFVK